MSYPVSEISLKDMKVNLDHRLYGVWYLHPTKWEDRFQNLSDPKSVEIMKARRVPRGERAAGKQDVATKKVIVLCLYFFSFLSEKIFSYCE